MPIYHDDYDPPPELGQQLSTPSNDAAALPRGLLIQRIKRVQNHQLTQPPDQDQSNVQGPSLLLSTPDIKTPGGEHVVQSIADKERDKEYLDSQAAAGLQIERPKSALHAGDFCHGRETTEYSSEANPPMLSTSPIAPWHRLYPASPTHTEPSEADYAFRTPASTSGAALSRPRATTQSAISSSFVLMPTTSPLVQLQNNADLDFPSSVSSPAQRASPSASPSPDTFNKRHTYTPRASQPRLSFHGNSEHSTNTSSPGRPIPSLRRDGSFPYQAHQPRRSLTSGISFHPYSTPQTPTLRPRRPSIASESSPLQHAPMVGSYEESILRGRMSTTPSRPLNFVAQIGVLGKGQCKANLKCPPHVTVPFPAVFYSYNSGPGKILDDSPSPYVGFIDLENHLSPVDEASEGRKKRRHTTRNADAANRQPLLSANTDTCESIPDARSSAVIARRRLSKLERRSSSPKAPPGGCYRIPQMGQLQIVIKNPHKTAVKLFLVPYDLSDMEPGTKTFVRQRSYSAGPIIDMPLSNRSNYGTDRPEAALSSSEDPNDRPILRYLIHLHICCTGKGRYYLYKGIRVVFANRVPDGKEKLRNEIQLPEPRFSAYKPTRDTSGTPAANALHPRHHLQSPPRTQNTASGMSMAEKAFRRRSTGFTLPYTYNMHDEFPVSGAHPRVPFVLDINMATLESRPGTSDGMDPDFDMSTNDPIPVASPMRSMLSASMSATGMHSPPHRPFASASVPSTAAVGHISSALNSLLGLDKHTYDKLARGSSGYGDPLVYDQGLLAKGLRELEEDSANGSSK